MEDKEEEIVDAEEEGLIEEKWSITRLAIGAFVLLVIIGAIAYGSLIYIREFESEDKNILGAQETEDAQIPTREDVQEVLQGAQNELRQINPADVVSSQDSIQRIIEDLESLQQTTSDPKKALCNYICTQQPEKK